jgi:hypothetical protein
MDAEILEHWNCHHYYTPSNDITYEGEENEGTSSILAICMDNISVGGDKNCKEQEPKEYGSNERRLVQHVRHSRPTHREHSDRNG